MGYKPIRLELAIGETARVELAGAGKWTVTVAEVADLSEPSYYQGQCHPVPLDSAVTLEVNGRRLTLRCRPFQLPVEWEGAQWSVDLTRQFTGGLADVKLDKDVLLSVLPAGESWVDKGRYRLPIEDWRWARSTYYHTWNGYVHTYDKGVYLHRGEDFGASPDRHGVVAPFAGTLVQYRAEGDGVSNAIAVKAADGELVCRFAHSNTPGLRKDLREGSAVRQGERLALSGDLWQGRKVVDPHLHYELYESGNPASKFNTWPIFVQCYRELYPDEPICVAGGFRFGHAGDTLELTGELSVPVPGRELVGYEWTFADGGKASGCVVRRRYEAPGTYTERLDITDAAGGRGTGFVIVRIANEARDEPPLAHINYYPMTGIKPGDPIDFTFFQAYMEEELRIDFGDGTSMGAEGNLTEAAHAYAESGQYLVTFEGRGAGGRGVFRTQVVIEPSRPDGRREP